MNKAGLLQAPRRFPKHLQKAINSGEAIFPLVSSRTRESHVKEIKVGAFWKRLFRAIFGGFAVITPMLLMVLYKHLLTSLLTTALPVFLFALAMAILSTADPGTHLVAVIAYPAVLVVFVGTSS
jgi:heme A synthase